MNSKTPIDCDVVIVNYNTGSVLLDAVDSAIAASANRIIVIDNASKDSSFEDCIGRFGQCGNVQFVQNNTNLGFAAACNIGFSKTAAGTVLFLNPDCTLLPNALEIMHEVLLSTGDVGMVGGLLLNKDGTEQAGGRRAVPTPWRSFVRAFGLSRFADRWPRLFRDFDLHKLPLPSHPIEVEAISGACMMVKRDAVTEVGLWDDQYFLHCEDLDWCMRFWQHGWKVMFVPAAKMVHIHGVSSSNRRIFVEWHKHKGMVRFYRKFFRHQYPGVMMWLVMLGVWLRFGGIVMIQVGRKFVRGLGLARE